MPKRPIVLVGMSVGAKVAVMVSFKIRVDALVCLSIQMQGINTALTK
jgi:dienelactone hydrolase